MATNYWDDLMNKRSQTQSGLGGALNAQQPTTDVSIMNKAPDATSNFSSLPGLPGDTATGGSMNSTTGLWSEGAGSNPAPVGSSDARDSRYSAGQAVLGVGTTDSLGHATALQGVMTSAPLPGGGGVQSPSGPMSPIGSGVYTGTGSSVGPAGPGPGGAGPLPPTGLPTRGPELDDPMSTLDNNLRFPQQSITPTDVMMDPGFKWQQDQLGRKIEDIFAAKGRTGSTDYFNTLTNANQKLLSDEYNRINNQQWERGMEMNRLLYDRRAQENVTNYEREFRENERQYGRQQAEQILAYERAFREDARDYDRLRYLVQLGFGATQASTGT